MSNFQDISYRLHEDQYNVKGNELTRLKDLESINFWRHERMYNTLKPLFSENKLWLTIGDGLGTDANWLEKQNLKVVASDIADSALIKAKRQGYIKEYAKVNAENIQLDDNSFDSVICKEAYHHFPRPYMALYEMIRVSRKAVILIEPSDIGIEMPLMIMVKKILDRFSTNLINKIWKNRFSFETIGNYVYKISEREIEKAAMGLNLRYIAFKGLNDYHSYKLDLSAPLTNRRIFNKVRRRIMLKNLLCKIGLIPYSLKVAVIFKEKPSETVLKALNEDGYKLIELPKNPYV